MISIILIYLLIATCSVVLFQAIVRWMQDGQLYADDIGVTALGGILWPIAYPCIILFVAGCFVFEWVGKASEFLYNTFMKGK